MNCRDASISLQLAEDKEVSPEEQKALDAHLGECLDCRRMAAWLEVVQESYPTPAPLDDAFTNDVLRCLSPGIDLAIEEMPVEESVPPVKALPAKRSGWFPRIRALLSKVTRRQPASKKGPGWSRRAAGALWAMVSGRRERKSLPTPEPGWTERLAGIVPGGFRAVVPAMAPAVAGPGYATGWIRITGSNLRDRARLGR